MRIELIGLDLDGTLLDAKGSVPDDTRNILQRIEKSGVKIAICTGRIYQDANTVAKELGLHAPSVVASNGAVVADFDGTFLENSIIPIERALAVLKRWQEIGVYHHAYDHTTIYANKSLYTAAMYERKMKSANGTYTPVDVVVREDLYEWMAARQPSVCKLMFVEENPSKRAKAFEAVKDIGGFEITSSSGNSGECMQFGVNKAFGLKRLAKAHGLEGNSIAAFGDSDNDVSMLRYAKFSVAMKNANESCKKAARYETRSNDEQGVAHMLRIWF